MNGGVKTNNSDTQTLWLGVQVFIFTLLSGAVLSGYLSLANLRTYNKAMQQELAQLTHENAQLSNAIKQQNTDLLQRTEVQQTIVRQELHQAVADLKAVQQTSSEKTEELLSRGLDASTSEIATLQRNINRLARSLRMSNSMLEKAIPSQASTSKKAAFDYYASDTWKKLRDDYIDEARKFNTQSVFDAGAGRDTTTLGTRPESSTLLVDGIYLRSVEDILLISRGNTIIRVLAPALAELEYGQLDISVQGAGAKIVLDGCLAWTPSKDTSSNSAKWIATDIKGATRQLTVPAAIVVTVEDRCHSDYFQIADLAALDDMLSSITKPGRLETPPHFGLLLDRRPDGLFVMGVQDNSLAAKTTIEAGDRILSIDGSEVADESLMALIAKIKGNPGPRLKLDIVSNSGIKKTVVMPRQTFYRPQEPLTFIPTPEMTPPTYTGPPSTQQTIPRERTLEVWGTHDPACLKFVGCVDGSDSLSVEDGKLVHKHLSFSQIGDHAGCPADTTIPGGGFFVDGKKVAAEGNFDLKMDFGSFRVISARGEVRETSAQSIVMDDNPLGGSAPYIIDICPK